jgi:hypothetical protein
MSYPSYQQAQDPDLYKVYDSEEETNVDETQLSPSVIPDYVTEAMSVDNIFAFLKGKGIPEQYCSVFKGSFLCGFEPVG